MLSASVLVQQLIRAQTPWGDFSTQSTRGGRSTGEAHFSKAAKNINDPSLSDAWQVDILRQCENQAGRVKTRLRPNAAKHSAVTNAPGARLI